MRANTVAAAYVNTHLAQKDSYINISPRVSLNYKTRNDPHTMYSSLLHSCLKQCIVTDTSLFWSDKPNYVM